MSMMFAISFVLLSAFMVTAQPLADRSLDGVATKIISLAVKTKKTKKKGKLVKGALAGLIVGIVVVLIILALIAFLLYKRQQKKKALGMGTNTVDHTHGEGKFDQHGAGVGGHGLAPPIVQETGVAGQQRTDGVGHV